MNAVLFIIIILIVYMDQRSKGLAFKSEEDICYPVIKKRLVTIIRIKNEGAALGILRKRRRLLLLVTVIMLFVIVYYFIRSVIYNQSFIVRISLSFIIGGALGNMIDRVKLKYVRDFFSFNFKSSPVFNTADMFIFLGVVMLEIAVIFNI